MAKLYLKKKFDSFEEIMRTFFADYPAEYTNRTATMKFGENRIVKITIVTGDVHGNYIGMQVEVVHKLNGLIDRQTIPFKSHMEGHVWLFNNTLTWMGDAPTIDQVKEYVEAIDNYIALWK